MAGPLSASSKGFDSSWYVDCSQKARLSQCEGHGGRAQGVENSPIGNGSHIPSRLFSGPCEEAEGHGQRCKPSLQL